MNRDPSVQSNLDRIDRLKQNRTRRLKEEPSDATPGDTILIGGDVLVRENDKWTNITKPLRDRIAALETLIETSSEQNEIDRERIAETSIETERRRREQNTETLIAFQTGNSIDTGNNIQADASFREPSPLEEAILEFALCNTFGAEEVRIAYPRRVLYNGKSYGGLYINAEAHGSTHNQIQIATRSHRYASEINADSTVSNTDVVRPQNIDLFSTVVHELIHHWQFKYELYGNRNRDGIYEYTAEDLKNPANMGLEQVASAMADWFVISWQIENTPDGTDVNLTNDKYWNQTVLDNFDKIAEIPHVDTDLPFDDGNVILNIPQRIVTEAEAMELLEYFEELRTYLCTQRFPRSPSRMSLRGFLGNSIRN